MTQALFMVRPVRDGYHALDTFWRDVMGCWVVYRQPISPEQMKDFERWPGHVEEILMFTWELWQRNRERLEKWAASSVGPDV